MRYWSSLALCLAATSVFGQDAHYSCRGIGPQWSAQIAGETARFSYIGHAEMDIPQFSRAEGRLWPVAMTLVSTDYSRTAILMIHERACNLGEDIIYDYEAQVLTQRHETPVLLTGCCRAQLP